MEAEKEGIAFLLNQSKLVSRCRSTFVYGNRIFFCELAHVRLQVEQVVGQKSAGYFFLGAEGNPRGYFLHRVSSELMANLGRC